MTDSSSRTKSIWIFAFLALSLFVAVTAVAAAGQSSATSAKIDRRLITESHQTDDIEFLVLFEGKADLSGAAELANKKARGQFVYDTLRQTADSSQAQVREVLTSMGVDYRPYWITNMIWVRGDMALVEQLARRSDVAASQANPLIQLDQPPQPANQRGGREATEVAQWNLDMTNAPAAWALGFEGQGIVIGGQDTGYEWTHPVLQPHYRGWDGLAADHDYNWHDAIHEENSNTSPGNLCGYDVVEPCDDNGHGTHTMGTMVGDDGMGIRTGMAPQAKWIGCRNMEDGWGTPATYTECYEWFIAPYPIGGDSFTDGNPAMAPDVINNSWSCPPIEGCSAETMLDVVTAVRAAGIVTVHSAGNSGSSCATVSTPAGNFDASFTVGAVSDSGIIAGFSSRGPAAGGLLKPDIVAPGVNVLSSSPGNSYSFSSGTSMASPHVAGMVALLLSAEPALIGDVDAIEARITATAVGLTTNQGCGNDTAASVPNNVYGWGLIDTAAAIADDPELFFIFTPFGVSTLP